MSQLASALQAPQLYEIVADRLQGMVLADAAALVCCNKSQQPNFLAETNTLFSAIADRSQRYQNPTPT